MKMISARINWYITNWCNYDCPYCTSPIFSKRTEAKQDHAFDYYSVEQWVSAIAKIRADNVLLHITGGELSLDRKNIADLVSKLTLDGRFEIDIDTNGTFDSSLFEMSVKKKIWLNVSFHPAHITIEKFIIKISSLRDSGYNIVMINFVISPDNINDFDKNYSLLTDAGFFVNVSAMSPAKVFSSNLKRTEEELSILKKYNHPRDFEYKVNKPTTLGKLCLYPTITYKLGFDGKIEIECIGTNKQNLIENGFPDLNPNPVPCPLNKCLGCVDMYRALADEQDNFNNPQLLYARKNYAVDITNWRKLQ